MRLDNGQVVHQRELTLSSQIHRLHDVAGTLTDNHWVVLYERGAQLEVKRLGRTGGTVATETIHAGNVVSACLGWHWQPWSPVPNGPFPTPAFYVPASQPKQILVRTTAFAADADTSSYGPQCGGNLSGDGALYPTYAFAGGELLLTCAGPANGTACALWVALGPGSSSLPGGCPFLLGSTAQVAQSFTFQMTSLVGHVLRIPLVDDPVFLGDLCFQVTWPDPSDPAQTKSTNGIEANIR